MGASSGVEGLSNVTPRSRREVGDDTTGEDGDVHDAVDHGDHTTGEDGADDTTGEGAASEDTDGEPLLLGVLLGKSTNGFWHD